MTISFVFNEVENMEVPIEKEIDIDKAVLILERQNSQALNEEWESSCRYSLILDDNVVYQSDLILPYEVFDLFSIIKQEVLEQEGDSEQLNDFLNWLEKVLKKSSKEKKVKSPKVKKEKKEPKAKRNINKGKLKILLATISTLIIAIVFSIAVFFFVNHKPDYSTLLEQKEYVKAVEYYPDKKEEIEDEIFQSSSDNGELAIQDLKQFNKASKTKFGLFDLYVLENHFEQALNVFEKNPNIFDNQKERLILVGYFYLKQDNVEKAESINKNTNSTELEEYIYNYKQLSLLINEKEEKIKELQKEPSKNAELIKKEIDRLFKAKEELENL